MKRYTVAVAPEALDDLADIEAYIAGQGRPQTAAAYVAQVLEHLRGFEYAPERGMRRDDLSPGLRVTNFKGRISIVFSIDGDRVLIAGLAYGGRPVEHLLATRPR